MDLGRIDDDGGHLAKVLKHAEGVVGVVNGHFLEWEEVSTLQQHLAASYVRAPVWYQLCNCWLRVVPVE